MRKHHLHLWKCSGLLLTTIVLLFAAGWFSSGNAHAFFLPMEESEPKTVSPTPEINVPTVPQIYINYEQTTEAIPYDTIRIASPDLPVGQERIAQSGHNGLRICDYHFDFTFHKHQSTKITQMSKTF